MTDAVSKRPSASESLYVLDRILAHARRAPDHDAVTYNDRTLSYRAFAGTILACRERLADLGLGGDGVVLLWIDDLIEGWLLALALRSLGATTAMLRTAEEAALFQSRDVRALLVLATERKREVPLPGAARRIAMDPAPVEVFGPETAPGGAAAPGGHILMTSGTTGLYKKVLVTTGAEADVIEARVARYQALGEGYRQQDETSRIYMFDFGLWTAAGYSRPIVAWSQGSSVVFHNGPGYHLPLREPGISHLVATPHYLARVLAAPEHAFPFHPDLQVAVVGGALSAALAREVRRRLAPRIVITLSATEVGGWARTVIENDEDLRWYRLDPGREVEVVDDDDRPVAHGTLGRVRVRRRAYNPTGYLDDPETTARHFQGDWFYPGDLGVLDGNGRLALFGRTTDIIHVQGNKLPAEPVERALQEALECEGVCVLSGPGDGQVEELHVFIESRRTITREQLAKAAQTCLWGFPQAHFHRVEALPRTGLGKISRVALAKRFHDGALG